MLSRVLGVVEAALRLLAARVGLDLITRRQKRIAAQRSFPFCMSVLASAVFTVTALLPKPSAAVPVHYEIILSKPALM